MDELKKGVRFDGCKGYAPIEEHPKCDQDIGSEKQEIKFPITCTYHLEFHSDPGALKMTTNSEGGEVVAEEEQSLKKRGRRTAQQQWVAKAAKKVSYGVENSCTPKHHGRDIRGIGGCEWYEPWNCDCQGWDQHTIDCWKPCSHYNDGYTQTVGLYCFQPCDREGQLALDTGCGLTPLDRTCVQDSGSCVIKWLNHALSIVDVLTTILSAGVAGAFKTAIKTAVKAGSKVAAKQGIKAAIKVAAKEFGRKLRNNKAIKRKITKFKAEAKKNLKKEVSEQRMNEVFDQGSELFLASSMGTEPDALAIADEIIEAVDPTGIYGLVKGWIPPEHCDDMVFMSEDIPMEEPGLPETDPLDGLDDVSCGGHRYVTR